MSAQINAAFNSAPGIDIQNNYTDRQTTDRQTEIQTDIQTQTGRETACTRQ